MRIAFDVLGTLQGPNSAEMKALFLALQKRGHEMFVWSSEFSYAQAWATKLGATPLDKFSHSEAEFKGPIMDLAIEDDRFQTWLAARAIVFVHEFGKSLKDNLETLNKHLTVAERSSDQLDD